MRILELAAGALLTLTAANASAQVVTIPLDASFAGGPTLYSFGNGSSIAFSLSGAGGFDTAAVSTTGTTQIASLGAPFYDPAQPTSYFTNRGGSIGPGTLAKWVSYGPPATIAGSAVESIIGFRFDLGQGYQYGYADIAGTTLFGVRFETTPGVGVAIGPISGGAGAVPEPAAWVLLIGGFAMTGLALRRRRTPLAA